MARARNIKPGFFKNELLTELGAFDRLLFIGLWCLADREGRIEDRPKRIMMELFPCDDYGVQDGIARLCERGFLTKYQAAGKSVISIVNFAKHQSPHGTEKDSDLPDENGEMTVNERSQNGCVTGRKRKNNVIPPLEDVSPPSSNALIPDSLIPDSLIQNQKPLSPDSDAESVSKAPRLKYRQIQEAYNEICPPILPACAVMNEKRKRQIKAMCEIEFMGSKPFITGIEVWRQYFTDCLTNKHWRGESGGDWKANFDFVTKPENAIKLMERMN